MGLEEQGAKPTGFTGKIMGQMMNWFHTPLYVKHFKDHLPEDNSSILDVGCGGGRFLKFLYESNKSYLLYGLDHSPEMIALSAKINKNALKNNRLKLIQGSVAEIELNNMQFDLITAFETVQFWPDTDKSFAEIKHLLKAGGHFLIINNYPAEGSRWWRIARIKSDNEYIHKLKNAGFGNIKVNFKFKNRWIIINATN